MRLGLAARLGKWSVSVRELRGCVLGVVVCGVLRVGPVCGIKREDQYWAVLDPEHWWLPFVYKRLNAVWASVLYMVVHKSQL